MRRKVEVVGGTFSQSRNLGEEERLRLGRSNWDEDSIVEEEVGMTLFRHT
jgi:hypothetical protein